MKLVELLKDEGNLTVSELQQSARVRFWELLANSGLKRWRKEDNIPGSMRRVLIGLAPSYSIPDLDLAERVINAAHCSASHLTVEFFDVTDVADMADMQNYIPGIGNVYQTPVVGVWEVGVLVARAQGRAGEQLALEALCGSWKATPCANPK